jgi:dipeptidyl-peptidase-4
LKGKFLLIHSGDDNVHLQNSMQMMEIDSSEQIDSQIYPDKNHGIYGNTRIQLYNKMTNFIKENL